MDTLDTIYSKDSNFYIARFEVQVLGKEQIYGQMPSKVPDTPYLGLYFYSVKVRGCKHDGQDGRIGQIKLVPFTYWTDGR
jgi:hypothetical protein